MDKIKKNTHTHKRKNKNKTKTNTGALWQRGAKAKTRAEAGLANSIIIPIVLYYTGIYKQEGSGIFARQMITTPPHTCPAYIR